jgi:hypothetical protein
MTTRDRQTGTRTPRSPLRGALGLLLFPLCLGLGPFAGGAEAQEREGRDGVWAAGDKARLGVYLEERCEGEAAIEARVRGFCPETPAVELVIIGGPADRAGIRADDILLTIDGISLGTEEGRLALGRLVRGVPVEIEVTRDSGRIAIEVVPEVMTLDRRVAVRSRFGHGDAEPEIEVFRMPDLHADLESIEVRLDSLRVGGDAFVFFNQDSSGQLTVEVGTPEKAERLVTALRSRQREIARQMRELEGRHPEPLEGAVALAEVLEELPIEIRIRSPRAVWENEELARRLEEVRATSLRSARVRLDSLVRLRSRVHVEVRDSAGQVLVSPPERQFEVVELGFAGPALPGELQALFVTDMRVAGAEFRELTPELAEYFQGADAGLLVLRVVPGTPAARLGLRGGDVVTEANGRICWDVGTLRSILSRADDSGGTTVKWIRKGASYSGNITGL